jgi:hypothetical protein
LIQPYLSTICSLANVSEPLFKLVYVQNVSVPPSSTPNIDAQPIFMSPVLPPQLADLSDYASSAAESLFFRVVKYLKARSPQAWPAEDSGEEANRGGDVFTELKVPMWPPLNGPQDEGGEGEGEGEGW